MAVRQIVYHMFHPGDVLTTRAEPVAEVDDEIRALVDDMAETMYDAPGIGLAAPQVGVGKRITVIDTSGPEEQADLRVLINPQIVHAEGKITWEEGCLSIPGVYEKVQRKARVRVRALDRDGQPYEFEADGLLAVAVQHELDHLDGVLFLDHLSPLKRRLALKKYRKTLDRLARGEDPYGDEERGERRGEEAAPSES